MEGRPSTALPTPGPTAVTLPPLPPCPQARGHPGTGTYRRGRVNTPEFLESQEEHMKPILGCSPAQGGKAAGPLCTLPQERQLRCPPRSLRHPQHPGSPPIAFHWRNTAILCSSVNQTKQSPRASEAVLQPPAQERTSSSLSLP